MRLLAVAVSLLVVLVACDGGSSSSFGLDSGFAPDTGTTSRSEVISNPMGTQVGSEGFWGCPIEEIDPIPDPTAPLDTLGASAAELTSKRVGSWSLQILGGSAGPVPGTLTLLDQTSYLWIDVTDGPGCVDHLAAGVVGVMVREGAPSITLSGFVAVRPDAGRLLLTAQDGLDSIAAIWGSPTLIPAGPEELSFRLLGDLSESAIDGSVSYVDCPPTEVDCASTEALAEVDGTR